jgi:hypothetical protein
MTQFDFEVTTTYPKEAGKVRLATIDASRHMNFIILPNLEESRVVTMSAGDAKKVRDALIRAYPIEPAKPEPSEYKTASDDHGYWYVYQDAPVLSEKVVARLLTQDNAKKIAKALNEAEGL